MIWYGRRYYMVWDMNPLAGIEIEEHYNDHLASSTNDEVMPARGFISPTI